MHLRYVTTKEHQSISWFMIFLKSKTLKYIMHLLVHADNIKYEIYEHGKLKLLDNPGLGESLL